MGRARALGILAAGLVAGLTAARLAPAAEPAGGEVLDLLQVAPDQRRRLVVGEVQWCGGARLGDRRGGPVTDRARFPRPGGKGQDGRGRQLSDALVD